MVASARLWRTGRLTVLILAMTAVAGPGGAVGTSPHELLVAEAMREGRVTIYSATDAAELAELLNAFRSAHPRITVDYRSLPASEVYARFKSEVASGAASADLVISSAMDLQIKLVNDEYAQPYASPERNGLPGWAVWKNEAFAVTAEPIVIGYNKHLLPDEMRPRSHDHLARLLRSQPDVFRGRVGSYDPTRSPTGLLYINQDAQIDRDSWDLITAIGSAEPRLFTSAREMIVQVSSGRLLVAYNLIGSYAFERAARDPAFGVIVPQDYVLVMSRVALISKSAHHSASAKLFLDFMLSQRGQALLAKHHMMPLRTDVPQSLPPLLGTSNIRAVRVGPALMANLDHVNREKFLMKWSENISAGRR